MRIISEIMFKCFREPVRLDRCHSRETHLTHRMEKNCQKLEVNCQAWLHLPLDLQTWLCLLRGLMHRQWTSREQIFLFLHESPSAHHLLNHNLLLPSCLLTPIKLITQLATLLIFSSNAKVKVKLLVVRSIVTKSPSYHILIFSNCKILPTNLMLQMTTQYRQMLLLWVMPPPHNCHSDHHHTWKVQGKEQ